MDLRTLEKRKYFFFCAVFKLPHGEGLFVVGNYSTNIEKDTVRQRLLDGWKVRKT